MAMTEQRSEHSSEIVVVVVAEDEWLIRMTVVDALTASGIIVNEAEDATAALSHLTASPDLVNVLFTDVQMPGAMDGLELAHHVRATWPRIGLLITSGALRPDGSDLPDGARFLAKPYEHAEVIRHVRELATSVEL